MRRQGANDSRHPMAEGSYEGFLQRLEVISRNAPSSISNDAPTILAERLEELAKDIRTWSEGEIWPQTSIYAYNWVVGDWVWVVTAASLHIHWESGISMCRCLIKA